ncbi:MAG: EAL domain-containing protein [Methylotenera sp.]|jgi:diguanylate cyclase (GGDEF)-like protein/PAS domain S-box-containing protein|nr:EAL domain-containing protein [Methylotenera sp.]
MTMALDLGGACGGEPDTVLIVEDEAIFALDLKQTLQALGYKVIAIASSHAEALELGVNHRPHLVLMDINLGVGGDGISAAEDINRVIDVPVVFLTAYADDEILRRAAHAVPYGYLVKPVQQRELNAVVQMALARFRASQGRMRAERRLRLALERAKLGLVSLPMGTELVEIDGYFPPVADESLSGLRMPLTEFLSHLSLDAQAKVHQLLAVGGDLHLLARWQGIDEGSTRWLEVHASYSEYEGAVVGICRDVTQQVQLQDELRQAAVVFESAADAILILNKEGRITTANGAFTRLTGWQVEEIRGLHPNDFLHARRGSDRELLAQTPLDSSGHAEVVCKRRDGSTFPGWEHVAPVRDEYGRVTQRVMTFTDISALRMAESKVRHLAFHDALTGLGNRHQLRESLALLASDEVACLLFLDLDGFKVINDSLGHDAGDRLLMSVAERIQGMLRLGDVAIRLGGDEFVLLLRSVGAEQVGGVARRVLDSVHEPIDMAPGGSVQISGSLGVAVFPRDGVDADALLRAADIAMYAAKAGGRNRYALYESSMAEAANERLVIEQGLLQAMGNGELSVHWQPQVELGSRRIVGAEALLRWKSPQSGNVPPDRFIPIAEECGLIQPLGRWVMSRALMTWAQWWQAGLVDGRVAVNVSALQLQDEAFVDQLAAELQASGLPAHMLEIEVTETALQRVPHVEEKLRRIRELGICIALDDFGTGYSSLSMLKMLPLKRMKVDRAFVKDVVNNSSDQAIVRAVVAMANAMGMELIAEGVERQEQSEWLREAGVMEAQGWLFARAMPADEFLIWLAAG